MLILDIDDTLVPRGGGISQKNAAAIQKAREAGVYVTLATGRGYYGSSHVFRELGLDTYVINYAGAVINDTRTDKPIFVTELDNSFVQEILAMADNMNLHAHLYQGDRIVYEREHPYASAYCAALNLPYSIDSDIRKKIWQNVPKVLIITEPERVSELLPFFKKHFENRVEVSASSPGFIEFNRLGANKGTAAELLASRLGFGRDEVAAAGDNTLDLELVRWAGLGAVVAELNSVIYKWICMVKSVPAAGAGALKRFARHRGLHGTRSALRKKRNKRVINSVKRCTMPARSLQRQGRGILNARRRGIAILMICRMRLCRLSIFLTPK